MNNNNNNNNNNDNNNKLLYSAKCIKNAHRRFTTRNKIQNFNHKKINNLKVTRYRTTPLKTTTISDDPSPSKMSLHSPSLSQLKVVGDTISNIQPPPRPAPCC